MSQKDVICSHLRRHKSITPIEAIDRYKILRLSARIMELKESGIAIVTKMVERNGKRYARYHL